MTAWNWNTTTRELLCQKGQIFISNIRVVYIAARPTVSLSSLAIPLQNLEDGKLSDGWMGGSTYAAACKSVQDEGFSHEWGHIKFIFRSKGADFKNTLDHLRSRLGVH
ncbi:hypothetical protein HDV03_004628 [Kappamyces sp. JEL0829]|nr:hypothetical protein HDV03_004628 [Kappamyces sp. JEL0829]